MRFSKFNLRSTLPTLVIALSLPMAANSQSGRLELWKNLYVGMPKNDVKNAMPEKNFEIATNCRAKFIPDYHDGRLRSVILHARWVMAYNDCTNVLWEGLVTKYGIPRGFEQNREDATVGFSNYSHDDQVFWIVENRKITLAAYPTGRFKFVKYEPHIEQEKELKTEL